MPQECTLASREVSVSGQTEDPWTGHSVGEMSKVTIIAFKWLLQAFAPPPAWPCLSLAHLWCKCWPWLWRETPPLGLPGHLDVMHMCITYKTVKCGVVQVDFLSVSPSFCSPSQHRQHTRGLSEPIEVSTSLSQVSFYFISYCSLPSASCSKLAVYGSFIL